MGASHVSNRNPRRLVLARTFLQSLNCGQDNEGVVATKSSDLVAITATATPASLAQVEALVSQLL